MEMGPSHRVVEKGISAGPFVGTETPEGCETQEEEEMEPAPGSSLEERPEAAGQFQGEALPYQS